MGWDPWHEVRKHQEINVDTRWRLPDGQYGAYDEAGKTIYLCRSLTQRERRGTLTHELLHVRRGQPAGDQWLIDKEERTVDELSARLLIDLDALIDALSWCQGRAGLECADELWTDVDTLATRLASLTDEERALLNDEHQRRN